MAHIAHGPGTGIGTPLTSYYTTNVHPLGTGACDYFNKSDEDEEVSNDGLGGDA
ncbi:MAG: hypothetical protein ACI89X_003506 [Planctomycetota bacterium]|jgi:hypothetical protein